MADATLDRLISGSIKMVLKRGFDTEEESSQVRGECETFRPCRPFLCALRGLDREFVFTEQRSCRSAKFATERQLPEVLRTEIACRPNGSNDREPVSEHPAGTATPLSYPSLNAQRK